MSFQKRKTIRKSILSTLLVTTIFVSNVIFPFANTAYRVVGGDTLSGIAQRHGITLEELYQANPRYRTNSLIMAGDIINIPTKNSQPIVYVVKSGDVLSVIAQRHGVTIRGIMDANGLTDPNRLSIGQRLIIPGSQTSSTTSTSSPKSTTITYVVKSGDVLSVIAQRHGVTNRAIMDANGLTDPNRLSVDQRLIIPVNQSTSQPQQITYVVKAGDTPWTISNQFGVTLNNFLAANNFNQNVVINIGQRVIIPNSSQATPQTPVSRGGDARRVTYRTHTVVSGDNLWAIGITYGIPMEELRVLNGLSVNHVLRIGDQIRIPVYHIPIKETPGPKFGELLDWWTEAQYLVPIGKVFTVEDFHTGRRWQMKRTIGANHADVEPLTAADTAIMREIWGGNWSWAVRPIIVEVDGRRLAASSSSMPHDVQYITNNNFNGHSDLYFLNSTRHVDGRKDLNHENAILIAAGLR